MSAGSASAMSRHVTRARAGRSRFPRRLPGGYATARKREWMSPGAQPISQRQRSAASVGPGPAADEAGGRPPPGAGGAGGSDGVAGAGVGAARRLGRRAGAQPKRRAYHAPPGASADQPAATSAASSRVDGRGAAPRRPRRPAATRTRATPRRRPRRRRPPRRATTTKRAVAAVRAPVDLRGPRGGAVRRAQVVLREAARARGRHGASLPGRLVAPGQALGARRRALPSAPSALSISRRATSALGAGRRELGVQAVALADDGRELRAQPVALAGGWPRAAARKPVALAGDGRERVHALLQRRDLGLARRARLRPHGLGRVELEAQLGLLARRRRRAPPSGRRPSRCDVACSVASASSAEARICARPSRKRAASAARASRSESRSARVRLSSASARCAAAVASFSSSRAASRSASSRSRSRGPPAGASRALGRSVSSSFAGAAPSAPGSGQVDRELRPELQRRGLERRGRLLPDERRVPRPSVLRHPGDLVAARRAAGACGPRPDRTRTGGAPGGASRPAKTPASSSRSGAPQAKRRSSKLGSSPLAGLGGPGRSVTGDHDATLASVRRWDHRIGPVSCRLTAATGERLAVRSGVAAGHGVEHATLLGEVRGNGAPRVRERPGRRVDVAGVLRSPSTTEATCSRDAP